MAKQPVDVRYDGDAIDEIVASNASIHIEQMSTDGWFIGIDGSDGSYWQFWIGAKNHKSAVIVRHVEHVGPDDELTVGIESHATPPSDDTREG